MGKLATLLARRRLLACCVVPWALAWPACRAQAPPSSAPRIEAPNLAAAVARQLDTVVSVSVPRPGPEAFSDTELDGLGFSAQQLAGRAARARARANQSASGLSSGFVIAGDGWILTNAHAVAESAFASVRLRNGRSYTARVIGLDKRTDIALLKIPAVDLPSATLGDASQLAAGDWVVAVGSPLGLDGTVTAGVVSAPRRVLPASGGVPLIQSDVAVNPGSSGGPLFNPRGEVVGVNTLIYSLNGGFMGIGLAVPIDVAMQVAGELRSNGRVRRGEIGAMVQELTHELALSFGYPDAGHALVTRVQPRSPAERAGLRSGDIVFGIDERSDLRHEQLQQLVAHARAGTRLTLHVWRAGALQRVPVVVREAPPDLPPAPLAAERRLPRLGLQLAEIGDTRRRALGLDGGLSVTRARGLAARGGLLPYDIIVALGAQPVRRLAEFDALLDAAARSDKPLALLVLRDGRYQYLAVPAE